MHFAFPPRKSSFPPPYARASARSNTSQRIRQLRAIGYVVFGLLTLYLVVGWLLGAASSGDNGEIPDDSSVLIVTVLDEATMSEDYVRMIKANRDDYALRHGYKTFYTNTTTYKHLTDPSPSSWSLIPSVRHALALYPDIDYIWSLSADALITNVTLSLQSHIFSPLSTLMRKDVPVVPPDSVIHTFSHLEPSHAHLILTQDINNLAHTSFILRNTQAMTTGAGNAPDTWSHYLLDAWFDPLYRAYSFQKAENHALEHIVQWHPTILAKIVVVDQRRMNSYNYQPAGVTDPDTKQVREHDSMWQPGDLIVNFKGCREAQDRDCEREMRSYIGKWAKEVEKLDGAKPDLKLKVEDYVAASKQAAEMIDDRKIHI